jgi:hypothetical protein
VLVVTPFDSTAESSRPSKPHGTAARVAISTTRRLSSSSKAIGTRLRSHPRRTPTRRTAASWALELSGVGISVGCACSVTRSAAGAAGPSPISAWPLGRAAGSPAILVSRVGCLSSSRPSRDRSGDATTSGPARCGTRTPWSRGCLPRLACRQAASVRHREDAHRGGPPVSQWPSSTGLQARAASPQASGKHRCATPRCHRTATGSARAVAGMSPSTHSPEAAVSAATTAIAPP